MAYRKQIFSDDWEDSPGPELDVGLDLTLEDRSTASVVHLVF